MSASSDRQPVSGWVQPELAFGLAAEGRSLAEARHRVAEWLAAAHWPAVAADDVVLAVNEAAANAIDHAYPDDAPGSVQVRCSIERGQAGGDSVRWVRVSITDQGAWSVERRTVDPRGFRGHGMSVMAACVEEVHLHREDSGTTVVLISHPAPEGRFEGAG